VAPREKRVIIVGSSGQDGTLLYDQLAARGNSLLGISRKASRSNEKKWAGKRIAIAKFSEVRKVVRSYRPTEIYFLAAIHHSSEDARQAELDLFLQSFEVNTFSLLHFLEAIRLESPSTRLFYASSSHVFGAAKKSPQNEKTPLDPENIYGISKATGMMIVRYYRRNHSLFASTGILYNHESPLRAERFVTKKIARGVANICQGKAQEITLGDLNSRVDWGYAPDYVEAMRKILSAKKSDDFVIASGKAHRVGDLAKLAFARAKVPMKGRIKIRSILAKKLAPKLIGDSGKLRRTTGWKPSVSFERMVEILVDSELGKKT
jgi:GDPmannose 4,6-dehydratase